MNREKKQMKNKKKKRTTSEALMDELEPIVHVKQIKQEMQAWEDEGGAIHPDSFETPKTS